MIMKNKQFLLDIYWSIVTVMYIIISFTTFRWAITWIVFPIAAIIFPFYRLLINRGNENDDGGSKDE